MNLQGVSTELSHRLISIFTRVDGKRPVYGGNEKFQKDPHWQDLILVYEYFHGDNGAGIGASHQTGLDRTRNSPHSDQSTRHVRISRQSGGHRATCGETARNQSRKRGGEEVTDLIVVGREQFKSVIFVKFNKAQRTLKSGSGPGDRRFKSFHPDHSNSRSHIDLRCYFFVPLIFENLSRLVH
jgi:hypothetical protein